MKLPSTQLIIGIILAVIIIVTSLWSIFSAQHEIERIPVNVTYEIGSRTGFNVETSTLNFGRILPGSLGTRSISINNTHDFPVYAIVQTSNDIRDMLIFNGSAQYIAPHDSLKLSFTLAPPSDMTIGNYTSFIVVHISK